MAELDSLIGCKISLISNQDIRYDGTLFSINQSESSIILKDVQAFGTEDRVTDKAKVVQASAGVAPFLSFPGHEIKDLYVHESTPAAPAPEPAKTEQKPKHENKPKPKHDVAPPKPPTAHEEKAAAQRHSAPAAAPVAAAPAAAASSAQSNNKPSGSGVGTGSHLLKLRERKDHSAPSNKIEASSDFDFAGSLNNFKKDEILATVAEENNDSAKKYTKDDFFDNLGGGRDSKGRLSASEERQLNTDTFGAIALSSGYRRGGGRGGRGGGRGRGGRGNGRGGGRGRGNNNNNTQTA